MGGEVSRIGPAQLEFALPFSQTFFDWNPLASLAPLSRGELEVLDTADGFEVSVRARARSWVTWLPLLVFAAGTGGFAFIGTPNGLLPAVAGLALLGGAWLRTWMAVRRFVETTNEEIAESFATVPPALASPQNPGAPRDR